MYGYCQDKSSSMVATFTQTRTLVACGAVIIHTEVSPHHTHTHTLTHFIALIMSVISGLTYKLMP